MTVVLVEDDSLIRLAFRLELEANGATVETASDWKECLSMIDTVFPDIIISDYFTNGSTTGVDMTRTLRKRGYDCPVVIVSGEREREIVAFEKKRGNLPDNMAFLTKPTSMTKALRAARSLQAA